MKDSFKELTYPELLAKREELKKQYNDVCANMIIGHVDNPLSKRTARRKLARVTSIIREFELGIRKQLGERHVEEVSKSECAEAQVEAERAVQKVLQGRVVSNKMQKTIVVEIHQRKLHRLYKKYLTRTKKIKAHDEKNECGIGDTVRVVESRPLSKEKRWRLLEIVEKAK